MKLRYFIYSSLFLAFCNTSAIAEENKPFTTQFSIGYMSQYISSGIDQNGNKGSASFPILEFMLELGQLKLIVRMELEKKLIIILDIKVSFQN
jgi:hypothetical protein